MSADRIRRRFRFTGRVQGVGFRRRAAGLARSLSLTGWVDNAPDGSVIMEIEGSWANVSALLNGLEDSWIIRIDQREWEDIPLQNDRAFTVR